MNTHDYICNRIVLQTGTVDTLPLLLGLSRHSVLATAEGEGRDEGVLQLTSPLPYQATRTRN